MWHATYATELRGLRIAPQADVLRLYTGLEPARAAGEQALQPAPGGCRASLDVINGSSADRPFSAGRTLTARGWLGTAQGTSPAHAFLVLTDAAGKRFLVPTRRVPRGDVAGHFGLPSMTDSGFIASANVQALRGAFRLALGYEDQGRIFTCPEVDLPGVLSGAPS
jgi:hypothetical protein